jgi:hypothetical protein
MENKEKRLLGGQEILFYAMNEASPKHFLIVAEIEGHTTKAAWQTAVISLQNAHPMLKMSVIGNEAGLYFYEYRARPMLIEIEEINHYVDLKISIEQELEKGFQSDQGPLARIKLFYSDQKCVVIIAAHHSIGDAFSSVNLLDDLLAILSGKSLPEFPLRPSVDEILGFKNDGLGAKIIAQIKPGHPLPHEFLKIHPPAKIDILHFSKDLTDKLAACAKKQATTVHGALQAASALTLGELAFDSARPAYIMSPFSVRKEMNIGTDCGLFIDTKILAIPTDDALDLWDIARLAKDGLSDIHTPEFLKSSAEQLRGLIGQSDDLIQFIKDNFNFDIMLSNIGRLSLENNDGALKVNYVIGPFIISGLNNQQAIGAATVNGQLALTNSSRYLVAGLLAAIQVKIEEACAACVEK